MKVLVVGATGTIGSEIVKALSSHEAIEAAHTHGIRVDISDVESIRAMYGAVGTVDAVISAAGS
ncbi:MAG TPA: NAD-dependent epimerase/dehydratase family protein, partial [Thermoanaerobaculia bacterium]|nr:NAD-dependent epimerase/dehydratase family protein [Thermoanaerobaculia bacterium]